MKLFNSKEVVIETKDGKSWRTDTDHLRNPECVQALEKMLLEDLTEESREKVKEALRLLLN